MVSLVLGNAFRASDTAARTAARRAGSLKRQNNSNPTIDTSPYAMEQCSDASAKAGSPTGRAGRASKLMGRRLERLFSRFVQC